MKSKNYVQKIVRVSMFVAIILILSMTPLGYIPLPFMKATTIHVPVIIGACLFGPYIGGFLGGIFGITSVIQATISPTITSFVFTPFYNLNEQFYGGFSSLIVAIVPRVLIGLISGFVFIFFKNLINKESISWFIAGIIGSITNTIGVMSLIYILFGEQYALATNIVPELLIGFILSIVVTNGIPEAIIAAILTTTIGKTIKLLFYK